MKETIINNILFKHPEEVSEKELDCYLVQMPEGTTEVTVSIVGDGSEVALDYIVQKPFERIRRITGYLVGTIDRWNNAKRKEEADRVKHSLASLT